MSNEENQAQLNEFPDLRRRAEEAMRGQQQKKLHRPIDPQELSAEDIQRLIHELQVHQIQLEIQNEELRRTQEQLEEWRNKYSDLYDFAPVGYFTVADDGRILEANLTGANLLGVARSDLIDEPIFHFIARDSQDQFYVHRRQVFETKANQVCELKLTKKNGRQFYAQLESIVVPDSAGNFSQFHTAVMDITARRQTQERLRQQEKMVAVGQLAGGIAHDFNNILQTIIGFTELLIHGHHDLPPDVQYGLRHINQQGQSAAQLVRQLLDFSRRSISEQHPLTLAPFLQELLKLLERTIPENVRLRLEHKPGQYWVKADVVQLEQALLNLAVNARDAMPDGGTLHLGLSRLCLAEDESPPVPRMPPGEWIVIRVSDTGIGIPENVLPHLFEPFFTTKPASEGTGLGLAQVYGIVRRHQGYIDVTSQAGQGTTFSLYLPSLPLPVEILSDVPEEEAPHGHGETLLLVEDESVVLEMVQAMLEHLGYQALTATNGREALEIYDRNADEIALVLTDMTMPELGGIALARTLWERDPTLKVVLLTGYLLETEARELFAQGIVAHLQKPLRLKQLAETVSRSLKLAKPGL